MPPSRFSRRDALRGVLPLAASCLLAPRLHAQAASFRFIVANDLHHGSAECDPFFRALVADMKRHDPTFCLIVGDIADRGLPESFAAVRAAFDALGAPIYTVPGNHDCDVEQTTRIYSQLFPDRLNYTFGHGGWQFVGLDSTDGNKYDKAQVSAASLSWLSDTVAGLDRSAPTVFFTHFPMSEEVRLASVSATDVLRRLEPLQVKAVFTGHFHARIERQRGSLPLVTNACCSRLRDNHDGSLEEGYIVCTAHPDGRLERQFVEFAAARKAS